MDMTGQVPYYILDFDNNKYSKYSSTNAAGIHDAIKSLLNK